MTGRARTRAFRGDRRATAAIEFVFVLPVTLTIFAGVIEFGRAWQVYGAVNRLASRYAAAWADCSDYPTGTCNTELSLYTTPSAVQNLSPQLTNAVTLRMIEIQRSGPTPTVVYSSPANAVLSPAELTLAQATVPVPPAGSPANTGVVVTVSYTHTLVFFQTLMTPFLGASRSISYSIAQLKS